MPWTWNTNLIRNFVKHFNPLSWIGEARDNARDNNILQVPTKCAEPLSAPLGRRSAVEQAQALT